MKNCSFITIVMGWILFGISCAQAENTTAIVDTTSQCLLETVKNGKWSGLVGILDDKHLPRRYKLYKSGRLFKEVDAARPVQLKDPVDDNVYYRVKFSEKVEPGLIAIGNLNWNLLPREVTSLNTQDKTYKNVVRRLLDKKGLKQSKVNITQLLKVDLEGDGVDEIFISASYLQPRHGSPKRYSVDNQNRYEYAKDGDYSFIMLRRIVKQKVVEDLLADDFHPPRSELEKVTTPPTPPVHHSVAAIMDFNGDGRMEMVIRSELFNQMLIYITELNRKGRYIGHPSVYLLPK